MPIEHGRPIVFANDRPIEFEVADYRQNLIHFGAEYLERIAAERSGMAPGPLRFRHDPPLTEAAIRRWHETVGAVSNVLGSDRAPHLLRQQAKRSVAEALLDLMPHVIDGPRSLPASASGRRLRRAVDYIHANAHLPLTITDIAGAAGLSLRGVQSAFRTNLEVAPLVYLRGVRLDRAREDLLDAGGSTAMVREIAQRWGSPIWAASPATTPSGSASTRAPRCGARGTPRPSGRRSTRAPRAHLAAARGRSHRRRGGRARPRPSPRAAAEAR